MRDLTDRALDTASAKGAGYADVRVVRRLEESIAIKTGRVEGVASGESEGFGVRVLVDGAWGFAASHVLTTAEADRVAGEAVRIARASATALRNQTRLDDRPPATGRYETPFEEDPFTVPLETKIADLLAADQAAAGVKGIAFTESTYAAQREWKTFAATDGSLTEQVITHVGAGSRPTPSTVTSTSAGATRIRAAAGGLAATRSSGGSAWPSARDRCPRRPSSS